MKKNIVIVVLGILLVDTVRANLRAQKAIAQIDDVTMYVANKLDENNIPMTEFDLIAVNTLAD